MTRPPELTRGPRFLRQAINAAVEYAHASRIATVLGGRLNDSPDGRVLTITARGGGAGGSSAPHPWEVLQEPPSDDDEPQLSVHLDSWLMGSLRCDDKITVTGLGAAFVLPAEVDQLIYLKVNFDAVGVVSSATVVHGPKWEDYPAPLSRTGTGATERQSAAYALIAYTRAVDGNFSDRIRLSDTVELVQCCHTNLRLCRDCYEGRDSVQLIVPHLAPGPVLASE